jgi:hypothetical protein
MGSPGSGTSSPKTPLKRSTSAFEFTSPKKEALALHIPPQLQTGKVGDYIVDCIGCSCSYKVTKWTLISNTLYNITQVQLCTESYIILAAISVIDQLINNVGTHRSQNRLAPIKVTFCYKAPLTYQQLSGVSDVLKHMFLQVTCSVGEQVRWELVRMTDQVLPLLTEVIFFVDLSIFESVSNYKTNIEMITVQSYGQPTYKLILRRSLFAYLL